MSRALCAFTFMLFSMSFIVSCGSATPEPVLAAFERPGRPWPSDTPPCTIPSLFEASSCNSTLLITAEPDGTSPVAVVARPAEVDLTWRELPVIDSGKRSKVDVFAPILFSGWASLNDAGFSLTTDVDIRSNRVVAKSGTPVSLVGTSRDKVIVRVPTSFKTPDAMEVAVGCHAVKYGYSPDNSGRLKSSLGYVTPRHTSPIRLRTSPEGSTFMVFEPRPDQVFGFIAQRGKAIRIAGGVGPDKNGGSSTTLFFEGWADVGRFYTLKKRPPNKNRGGCLPRSYDKCPSNFGDTIRDAMLYYGREPPGQHFATVKIGTALRVGEEFGDLSAVSFMGDAIAPPRGLRYFVKRDAIRRGCQSGGSESALEGCAPCVE